MIAAHNSMGQIESAKCTLRIIYRILSENYPNLSGNIRINFSVKALNDTAGLKGLVPSLLVFGTILSLGSKGVDMTDQGTRFKAMHVARNEATKIIAEQRMRRALQTNTPPSANYQLRSRQNVMAYSEKQKKWVRDMKIVDIISKKVWVNYRKMVFKLNMSHVVPQPSDDDTTSISKLIKRLSPLNYYPLPYILVTEILPPNDPRCKSSQFDLAKAKESLGLLDKNAFRLVLKEELDSEGNVMGGRFFLTIEHKDTDKELFKARFVVQGYLDSEKELLVHASTRVSQQAVKFLVHLATIFGYRIWSEDMTLAYFQGAEEYFVKYT